MPRMNPLGWIGSTKQDLLGFPAEVIRDVGHALYLAQIGARHPRTKPLRGFGGASVVEIIESFEGDAYRVVYTIRFRGVVYVLHAFQKKSTQEIATPQRELDVVHARLKQAQEEYAKWLQSSR